MSVGTSAFLNQSFKDLKKIYKALPKIKICCSRPGLSKTILTKPTVRSAFLSRCSGHAREWMCALIRTPRKRQEALSQKKITGRLRSDQAWVAERRGENGVGRVCGGAAPLRVVLPVDGCPLLPPLLRGGIRSFSLPASTLLCKCFSDFSTNRGVFFFKVYLLMENCHTSKIYVLSIYNEPSRLQARKSLCP